MPVGKILMAAKIFVMRSFSKAKASVTIGGILMGGYKHHRNLEIKFLDLYVEKKVKGMVDLYNTAPNVEQLSSITSQVRDQAIMNQTTCLKAEFIIVKGFKGAINILYDVSGT